MVETGSLNYVIFNDDEHKADISTVLSPNKDGVIEPQVFHKVELLSDNTSFYVEFYAKESSDIGVPKFIKEGDVNNVEKEHDIIENIRSFLIQVICVGILVVLIGFILIQVSNMKQSLTYTIPVESKDVMKEL